MTFDAERHGKTTARVNHARVFSRADQDLWTVRRQARQVHPAGLVGAMFAPHDCIHGQLEMVGLTTQEPDNHLRFIVRQPEGSMDIARHDHEPTGRRPLLQSSQMDVRYCPNGNEISTS